MSNNEYIPNPFSDSFFTNILNPGFCLKCFISVFKWKSTKTFYNFKIYVNYCIIYKNCIIKTKIKTEYQQDSGQPVVCVIIFKPRKQHWPLAETHNMGPPHSCSVIIVSPAVPTTPTTPRGVSRRGRREAVAAWPAAAVAVVARRANPPDRSREGWWEWQLLWNIQKIKFNK